MIAARSSACSSHWARRSSRSTVPSSAALTTTTFMPAITAEAALVPCADDGIRQTSRSPSPLRPVVAADGQQPGELALRAGVGLDRDPVVAGDLGQPALELVDELAVAGGVLGRREGVQVGEAGQADRLHLGGGVELHRARAERDHAAVQRVVAGREAAQVAQHLGLAVVGAEDLVREVRRRAAQVGGQAVRDVTVHLGRGDAEGAQDARHGGRGRALRGADADPVGVDQAQLEPEAAGARRPRRRPGRAPRR